MQCGPEWVAANILEILDYAGLIVQAPGTTETPERASNRRSIVQAWVVHSCAHQGRVGSVESAMSLICTASIQEMYATRELIALWGDAGPVVPMNMLPCAAQTKLKTCIGKGGFTEETTPLFNPDAWVLRRPTPATIETLEAYEWRENVLVSMAKVMIETSMSFPYTVLPMKQCMETATTHCRVKINSIAMGEAAEGCVSKQVATRLMQGIFRDA